MHTRADQARPRPGGGQRGRLRDAARPKKRLDARRAGQGALLCKMRGWDRHQRQAQPAGQRHEGRCRGLVRDGGQGIDPPAEMQAELVAAEFAIFTTPAPDIKAVAWKMEQNLIEGIGAFSIEEALAQAQPDEDLDEACQVSVYRDLLRLAGLPEPSVADMTPANLIAAE